MTDNQPVTRVGRIIQQLRSFAELHANELEGLASDLDSEAARRLRAFRDIQRDETMMVVQELTDLQDDLVSGTPQPKVAPGSDPAAYSPRRAKWLAEQQAELDRRREPMSRRELFERVANPGEEQTPSPGENNSTEGAATGQ